ncbi:ERF family protein [Burkholderia multivorans]|uniref:ERF family protein n=1 Tax=Burkholderia multivorans TaxID=87883 RepID=UPI0019D6E364|nr:ERF family protein [Burkholderia multivorans]MBN8173519.1 ERF family protein [Burkholderia multivorans]
MKTSDSISKIAAALLAAQKEITFASKDATNPHFKNKYADLGSVVEAVKPALNEAGIVYIQTASPSDDGKLHLTTRLMHESGEWIEDTLVMPLPKPDPQGFGSAMTYARRYALAAITGVYQDDDDGNAASRSSGNAAPADDNPASASDVLIAIQDAKTVPELVQIMNGLSIETQKEVRQAFNKRMTELKKAA